MKKIYMLAAALIGLNGCVVYPDDYQDVYYADQTYVTTPYAGQTTYIVQESSPNVVYVDTQPTYVYSYHSYHAPRRPIHTPPHLHRRPEAPHHHHAAPKHHDSSKPHNGKHHK